MKLAFAASLSLCAAVLGHGERPASKATLSVSRDVLSCAISERADFLQLSQIPANRLTFGEMHDRAFSHPATFVLVYKDQERSHGTLLLAEVLKKTGKTEINVSNLASVVKKQETFDFDGEAPLGGVWTQSRFIRAARKISAHHLSNESVENLKSRAQMFTCSSELFS